MSWKDVLRELGGGDVSFLTVEGEEMEFVVVDVCVPMTSKYKNVEQQRIGAPIVTLEGFSLLIMGMRLARRLGKYEKRFREVAFKVTRVGGAGDQSAKYPVQVITDENKVKALWTIAEAEYIPELLEQAIKDAEIIMKGR